MSPKPAAIGQPQTEPNNSPGHRQVKVKICGLTNLADARLAVRAGADLLGFIFYAPSRRAVTIEAARHIVAELRAMPGCPLLVGVFVNEAAQTMAEIMDTCQLDLAQLNGEEVPALIGEPGSPLYGRSYKVLRPTSLAEAEADAEWYRPPELAADQPGLLLDTYHPALRGGTGQTVDWTMAARLAALVPNLMLAGGLQPDNVAEAVHQVRPFAVDVASGVEASPGRKDATLVQAFISRAKAAL